MSDNLTVFGVDYTNVTGIKAHATSDSSLMTYIRPQGTKSIAANGVGIDVTEYASVDVAVPAQDSTFVVNLSWDDDYFGADEGAWVPDCTFAEVLAAYQAGKTITVATDFENTGATADGYFFADEWTQLLTYCVEAIDGFSIVGTAYLFDGNGLVIDDAWECIYPNFDSPSRTYTPTTSQQTETITYDPNDGYNGIQQVDVTVNAVPTAEATVEIGNNDEFYTSGGNRYWRARPYLFVDDAGWVGSDLTGAWKSFTAVPANTTITPTTSSQTIGGSKYMMEGAVTVAAMPTGTAGTPTATKGAVSNHSVSVTPSVTNTTGYITGSTKTGTAVTVSASELVSGSQTVTNNGTVDVTNLASVVVDVQGGSPSLHIGTTSATSVSGGTILFEGLSGTPTSYAVIAHGTIATSATPTFATVSSSDTQSNIQGQLITNTSNAQVTYEYNTFYPTVGDDYLAINAMGSMQFSTSTTYDLIYTYGGGAIDTKQVQVGSGATSITFTGLEDEPACWYVIFQSNFSTSSGYQRVIAVANDGVDTYGMEMDSSAHYSDAHWSSTYSNGSLTITSQGTNAGGYFHQPGYYELIYAYGASGNYQSKTVTPSQSTQEVTADQGYDALRKVTVNPIPSEYVIPTGSLSITANNTYDVTNYASAVVNVSGGGSVQFDTKTATASDYPTSLQFTGMKGQPKAFVLRLNAQVSSSGSTTYYYIVDIAAFGTTTHGNCFRIGSTRRVDNITSGYSWSYSGTTLTVTSNAGSRSASPGAFYSGSYELMYAY